jgi:hypothetical protein
VTVAVRETGLGWGLIRFEEELKTEPRRRSSHVARARAIVAVGSLTLIAAVAVAPRETVRAAGESPSATSTQLFGVHPVQEGRTTLPGGHFNFALVPGQRISDAVVVENFSTRALRFHVYGADLLTAAGGGLTPAQPTATMHEVGAWITVSVPAFTVAAHSQYADHFTLTVPTRVSPGQHLGAVVAAADVGVTAQGDPIEARAALIAVVAVPGAAHPSALLTPLVASDAGPGRVAFGVTLSNTGNVLLTYAGFVVIADAAGHRVATLPLTPTNAYVVPSGQTPLAVIWTEPAPLADTYRAEATVTIFANGKPIRTLTSESLALEFSSGVPAFVPVGLGFAIGALILLLVWIARIVAGRRHGANVPRVGRTGSVA